MRTDRRPCERERNRASRREEGGKELRAELNSSLCPSFLSLFLLSPHSPFERSTETECEKEVPSEKRRMKREERWVVLMLRLEGRHELEAASKLKPRLSGRLPSAVRGE